MTTLQTRFDMPVMDYPRYNKWREEFTMQRADATYIAQRFDTIVEVLVGKNETPDSDYARVLPSELTHPDTLRDFVLADVDPRPAWRPAYADLSALPVEASTGVKTPNGFTATLDGVVYTCDVGEEWYEANRDGDIWRQNGLVGAPIDAKRPIRTHDDFRRALQLNLNRYPTA